MNEKKYLHQKVFVYLKGSLGMNVSGLYSVSSSIIVCVAKSGRGPGTRHVDTTWPGTQPPRPGLGVGGLSSDLVWWGTASRCPSRPTNWKRVIFVAVDLDPDKLIPFCLQC